MGQGHSSWATSVRLVLMLILDTVFMLYQYYALHTMQICPQLQKRPHHPSEYRGQAKGLTHTHGRGAPEGNLLQNDWLMTLPGSYMPGNFEYHPRRHTL
jgi:hypothetical protein